MRDVETPLLDLVVTIRYHGIKATAYFSKFSMESVKVVRQDLLSLKLPFPKTANIALASHGCVEFWWDGMAAGAVLHMNLCNKINPLYSEDKHALRSLLKDLSITSISLKESPSFDAHTQPTVPQKRSNPHSKDYSKNRLAPQLSIKSEPATRTMAPIPTRAPAPPPTPPMSVSSTSQEATVFLDDMEGSLRPSKKPKIELREPMLRFTPSPRPRQLHSISSSVQEPTPPLTQAQARPPQSKQLPASNPPLNPPPTTEPTDLGINCASQHSQALRAVFNAVPERERIPPTTTIAPPNPPEKQPMTNPGSTDQTTPPPPPVAERATTTTSPSLAAITGPPPNPSEVPKIQRLTRELWDIRRTLTADGIREKSIVEQLKRLHASYIPEPMSASTDRALLALKMKLREAEKDLENERWLRAKAETTLQDIRRECKAPFVVPGLLDAFISISNLTTKALQSSKGG